MTNTFSILVVGQGSIGTRHREVLSALGHQTKAVSRRRAIGDFDSISQALAMQRFDAVVISSETGQHVSDLMVLQELKYRGAVLIEKPISLSVAELDQLAPVGNTFVAYNLRFFPVVQELRAAIMEAPFPPISAHLQVAQAIDTWRPGRSREASYSAFRDRGGGVLRDLSHELDLATWLFGPVERVAAVGGRYSDQTVDSDDAWSIMAVCRDCPQVMITINGIDRTPRRAITVTTADRSFRADLIRGELESGSDARSIPVERNDSYRAMWQALLADGADVCTFAEGAGIMQLIAAIETANQRQSWVDPRATHE